MSHGMQEVQSTCYVDLVVELRSLHGFTHQSLRCKMYDTGDGKTGKDPMNVSGSAKIAFNQCMVTDKVPMARRKIVKDDRFETRPGKSHDGVATDVACSTGDQDQESKTFRK